MEVTTFDFGDVDLGTIEDDERTVPACGVVTFGRKAMLQLSESAIGHLDRLEDLEPGFVTFVGADGLGLTDADYRAIASVPGLRSVDFDNTQITTDQIGYFCTSEVRALNLATESLTDDAMPAIASMPGLVHLFASRSAVSDVGVAFLRGHEALETLHLAATKATAESAEVIASLPSLTTLEFPSADDAVLTAAAREQTTFLHLERGKVSEAGIRALSSCLALTWLGLVNAELDSSACAALGELVSVETLFLNMSSFDDAALGRALRSMTGLFSLNLRNTSASDTVLAGLARLPRLASVYAVNTQVTDAGVAHLASVPTLQNVDFAGTSVTSDGLALLTQLPKPFELR